MASSRRRDTVFMFTREPARLESVAMASRPTVSISTQKKKKKSTE